MSVASFSIEHVPTAELVLSGLEEDEVETSATTLTAKFAVPIPLRGRDTVLLNFFTLRSLQQTYVGNSSAGGVFRPDYLYTFKYGLVLHQIISDRWTFAVLAQPALLSDFENLTADHVTLRAGFVFERRVSDRLKYGFGLGFSDDYGEEKLLP
ncbi:MAG: DUF6268 family outer membrane beta-barrel protein, partial [Candidatus Krumholzibacteriia bacterium]